MAVNRIPRKLLEKKVAFFIKHGIPYRMENTNERTVVRAEGRWGTWMNKESSFDPKHLHFIKSVKDYIVKNETWKQVKNNFKGIGSERKIHHYHFSDKYNPGDYFENIIEIDIKSAYWEQLNKLGIISEELYLKGKEIVDSETTIEGKQKAKQARLAAVGTLAKTTEVINFDGKTESLGEPIRSKDTEFLWNVISYRIGKLMTKFMRLAKNDFIFFWTDAMFIHGDSKKLFTKLFKEAGFECSVHKCEWVRFYENKIVVYSKEKGKWLRKKERQQITLPSGKKAVKIITRKVWTEERPFHYKKILTDKDLKRMVGLDTDIITLNK